MANAEVSAADLRTPGGETELDDTGQAPRPRPRRRWRVGHSIALAVFTVYALVTLYPTWAHFITFGSSDLRVSAAEYPLYFPVLMVHVTGATVALLTCILQVWPWLRRRYPTVHRYAGRIYIFAGVYPAVFAVVGLIVFWPFSAVTAFQQVVSSAVWFSVTTYGWVLARRGWIADHRRWMLRSFALTGSVLLGMVISIPIDMILRSYLDTRYAGSEDILRQMTLSTETWMAFVLSLIAVEWWLERDLLRRTARRHARLGRRTAKAQEVREAVGQ